MPETWAHRNLRELLEVQHGYPFASDAMSETITGNPIIVSIGNFNYRGGFRFDSTRIREFTEAYPKQFELSPGDLLIAMTCQTPGGEILGLPGIVPDDGRIYLHNQRIGKVIINPALIDRRYAYYCFLSRAVNQQLVSTASGTKILHTAPARIGAVQVDLPPLSEQRAIAATLGTLDDKIAVNDQIARTSLDLAEAMYMHLEVQSASIAALGDLIDLEYGRSLPASIRHPGDIPVYGSNGRVGTHDQALAAGPGVIIGRKGTVGAVHWSEQDFFPIDTTFYAKARSRSIPLEFVFFTLRSLRLGTMNSDSAVPGLNRSNALMLNVRIPDTQEMRRFGEEVRPIFALRHALDIESASLARLRDTLLPRLMSGEIRVRDAEKVAEEAT